MTFPTGPKFATFCTVKLFEMISAFDSITFAGISPTENPPTEFNGFNAMIANLR
jgi:hypothetical protein